MKKLLILVMSAACTAAYALPTYEPFTEFNTLVATTGSNLVAAVNGVPLGTTPTTGVVGSAAIGGVFGGVDLATGRLTATNGEAWTSLNFSGINSTGTTNGAYQGADIALINNPNIFTSTALSPLLPASFPGFPASGAISTMAENPAQPLVYTITSTTYTTNGGVITTNNNYGFSTLAGIVGNSAVLNFSQDITRPASGTKTVYVSYLLSVVQQGQAGAGNDGRYLAFLCKSNLVEGAGTAGAYQNWWQMFNTFGVATTYGVAAPVYASHGLFSHTAGTSTYYEPCDSSTGKSTSSTTFSGNYGTPVFVVGAYQFSAGGNDTNALWVNPSLTSFGGAAPPASPVVIDSIATYKMTDIAGLALIDRAGSGASGGAGTNYVANLLVGTTWSYVTGGPEFTNQPVNANISAYGTTVSLTGAAVAAAQSVTYQWQRIIGTQTNLLSNGAGTAGGGATVSGVTTSNLVLTGVTAGDLPGFYQLTATAAGTGYALSAPPVSIIFDPFITTNPVGITVNYGGKAQFNAAATTIYSNLTYQWYAGSTPLVNGTKADGSTVSGASGTVAGTSLNTTLTLSNVTYLEDGGYSVLVTNNVNNAVSSISATLAVNDPIIVTQPSSTPIVVTTGGSGSVSIVAAGTGLTYQWYGVQQGQLSNGGDFSGVTSPTLTISNAQTGDADTYYVVVTGSSTASVQSSPEPVYVESSAEGPFSQTDWPASIDQNAAVDYAIWDPGLYGTFSLPSGWNNVLALVASGGDQTWSSDNIDGGFGYDMTGTYFNIADPNWGNYTNVPVIDILLNVYGNSSMYSTGGAGLPTTISEGNVAVVVYEHQGAFPPGADNSQWNWLLLTVTNPVDANGYRVVGDPTYGTTAKYGGVNNGTLRLEGFNTPGFIIRAVAMGPHGAFGTTNQINRFVAPPSCAPEPTNNLAWVDFNQGTSNNLSVLNDANAGETYTVQSGVGPSNDQRTAIQSSGLMEMPILNDYLGLPCNEDLTMEVGIEFYDDPALAGESFGPAQYATDYQGDLATYAGSPYTMTGSGQWLKVAFYVGPLNLNGVNTAPLTGGPSITFNGTPPYIDRVEVGLIRTGTNALAGQIPDPSYYIDPLVYTTNYGFYAEWNPNAGIANNVDIASGYNTTLAGPVNDRRLAEIPISINGGSASYLQWSLLNQAFGPTLQDNADVIMSLTYYDDPALAGNTIYPNVYSSMTDGNIVTISPSSPYNAPVILQGSGKWQVAQFELPNVNFQNGSGQYVCRYAASAPVYVSDVSYDIIRPAGPFEGIDYLQSLGMSNTNSQISLNWRGTGAIQGSAALTGPYQTILNVTNTATNVFLLPMTNTAGFFQLEFPAYPSYLSTYIP